MLKFLLFAVIVPVLAALAVAWVVKQSRRPAPEQPADPDPGDPTAGRPRGGGPNDPARPV